MELPSAHQIGDPVWVKLNDDRKVAHADIKGHIRYVVFTTGKVRYGVFVKHMQTTLHNLDSVFVEARDGAKRIKFDFDNLS